MTVSYSYIYLRITDHTIKHCFVTIHSSLNGILNKEPQNDVHGTNTGETGLKCSIIHQTTQLTYRV